MTYHKSVLVREVLQYLAPRPGGVYIDATFGGGGHTRAILEAEPTCTVIACDWDTVALETNGPALERDFPGRITFIWTNFTQLPLQLKKRGIEKVDGIVADFGTSQFQIHHKAGFSFATNTPLDMRMSPGHHKITAADIVNTASEQELITLFFEYGGEPHARKIARAICEQRRHKPFTKTKQLVDLITAINYVKPGMIHPATRVFQALRIVVNKELDNIKTFLLHAPGLLDVGGRLVCISFHSLEDRLVKRFIKENEAKLTNLTPKVVTAQEDERQANASARSACLRAAEKK